MSRQIKNIIAITFFLICIGLINVAGQNIEIEIRGINAFTFILIVAVLLQIIFFIPSFLLKTEKYFFHFSVFNRLIIIIFYSLVLILLKFKFRKKSLYNIGLVKLD